MVSRSHFMEDIDRLRKLQKNVFSGSLSMAGVRLFRVRAFPILKFVALPKNKNCFSGEEPLEATAKQHGKLPEKNELINESEAIKM